MQQIAARQSTPHETQDHRDSGLHIAVVFTTVSATLVALRRAAILADKLNARISLMAPQVVPFPAALEISGSCREFNKQRFRVLGCHSRIDMDVHICVCRDRLEELRARLVTGSIVVMAGRNRWPWRSSEERLARKLQDAGHEVIFLGTE